ncbi:ABC transporter ATP-binding protein [Caldivirga sp. MU80]|uniref:ABC transporter ATP-binding protein n=1 Tax=Caldivirga sp. MU80 TaxID=1650354 RepID=UPI0008326C47|nr:ABC transporter ATP-binding protein [Caldivirga sp. MU80]
MLEVTNVKVKYRIGGGVVEALRGVSLRVNEPLLVTVSGPSGSGKTTLLKAIAGRVNYDGSIKVMNLEVKYNMDAVRKLVLYLPVGEVLIDELTIDEIMRLASMSSNVNDAHVDDILEWLGLSRLRNRRVFELSTGERRRVELAIALAKAPRLMLIDEPTIGLDEGNARIIGEVLRSMSRQGRLILAATHDPVLMEYSDLNFKMRDGLILTR